MSNKEFRNKSGVKMLDDWDEEEPEEPEESEWELEEEMDDWF